MIRAATLRATALFHRLASETARRPKTVLILIWIVALVPMIHLTSQVRHYGVNVPMLDDWEMAPLIVKAHTGELRLADVFQQQQEARTILPKLIFILSAARGEWDVRDQMMLSVVICWLTAGGVFLLLRRSGLGTAAVAICFWLSVLTIFSLAQFELWIFASGFPSFLPAFYLVAALVVLTTSWPTRWKFLVCVALAVASSFTLPHGLLAWGLMFPTLFLLQRVASWRLWLGLWVIAGGLSAAIYFWGYQKPDYLPAFAPAASPVEYLRFVLIFLGNGFANSVTQDRASAAATFGGISLLTFLGALIYAARRVGDRAFRARIAPWLVLGTYSLASSGLAALGRIGFGVEYAGASRYVPFSHYITIAAIVLVAIVAGEIAKAGHSTARRLCVGVICLALFLAFLIPYRPTQVNSLYFLRRYSAETRLVRGAVLFSAVLGTSQIIKKLAYPPDADRVIRDAAALNRLHLLRPSLVQTKQLNALPRENADGRSASGSCETLATLPDLYRASGWAVLNAKGRPADCVLVAYHDPQLQEWVACALSDSIAMRPDIVKRFRSMDRLWAGWTATFPRSAIPAGAQLSFWAVNADEAKLHQLEDNTSHRSP